MLIQSVDLPLLYPTRIVVGSRAERLAFPSSLCRVALRSRGLQARCKSCACQRPVRWIRCLLQAEFRIQFPRLLKSQYSFHHAGTTWNDAAVIGLHLSLPLNRSWRLGCNVVHHAVDAFDLVDDAVGGRLQYFF